MNDGTIRDLNLIVHYTTSARDLLSLAHRFREKANRPTIATPDNQNPATPAMYIAQAEKHEKAAGAAVQEAQELLARFQVQHVAAKPAESNGVAGRIGA